MKFLFCLAVVLVSTFIICLQYLQDLGALTFLSFKKSRSDVVYCNAQLLRLFVTKNLFQCTSIGLCVDACFSFFPNNSVP